MRALRWAAADALLPAVSGRASDHGYAARASADCAAGHACFGPRRPVQEVCSCTARDGRRGVPAHACSRRWLRRPAPQDMSSHKSRPSPPGRGLASMAGSVRKDGVHTASHKCWSSASPSATGWRSAAPLMHCRTHALPCFQRMRSSVLLRAALGAAVHEAGRRCSSTAAQDLSDKFEAMLFQVFATASCVVVVKYPACLPVLPGPTQARDCQGAVG